MSIVTPPLWAIIAPLASRNLHANPSFERDLTGWVALETGSIARTTAEQYKGAHSLAVTPGTEYPADQYAGAITTGTALEAGTWTISVYHKGHAGYTYELGLSDGAVPNESIRLASTTWVADGDWHRYSVTVVISPALNNTAIWVAQEGITGEVWDFWIDGLVIEPGGEVTTYIDGDQPGCVWTGPAHASESTRPATTRLGGQIVPLDEDLGIVIDLAQGLGMAPVTNEMGEPATGAGAIWARARPGMGALLLRVNIPTTTAPELLATRERVLALLAPDATPNDDPLLVQYAGRDEPRTVACHYDGGFGIGALLGWVETTVIRLLVPNPVWQAEYDQGASNAATAYIGSGSTGLLRWPDRQWDEDGNGIFIRTDYCEDALGNVYMAGNVNGDPSNAFNVYAHLPSATSNNWLPVGFATRPDKVSGVAYHPDGTLYATNSNSAFTQTQLYSLPVGSDLFGATWTSLGSTFPAFVRTLVVGPDGTLYAGTNAGLYQWSGSSWTQDATINNGDVYTIVFDGSNGMLIGGSFTGSGFQYLAYRPVGGSWQAFTGGSPNGSPVRRLLFDATKTTLYIAGGFGAIGTTTVSGFGIWNGSQWRNLGSELIGGVQNIALTRDGLWVGGSINGINGVRVRRVLGAARWSGSFWYDPGLSIITQTGNVGPMFAFEAKNGRLFINSDNSLATSRLPVSFSVQVDGNEATYPVIVLTGTGFLREVQNYTTGGTYYLNAYPIQANEIVTIDTSPAQRTVRSSLRGDISNQVAPGSRLDRWTLAPGLNTIGVLLEASDGAITLRWRPRYQSADG